jgi:hypothetical protein
MFRFENFEILKMFSFFFEIRTFFKFERFYNLIFFVFERFLNLMFLKSEHFF